ncbi:uroporphyrinogen-III synthase [Ceratina calcarata]|uniref:Uroporphyrinogen-III synthase n=1 Tax=Ceratina calcarata TaxID=156304 RepID=A0AAJ7NAA1_9HYME|nr:uroporphyrinogen-III synthase [Ceratina calcarata]XP_026672073.1 uroporphyrinogen-III synthase [Ceratina calcarata]
MAVRYERVILCRGTSEKSDSQESYVNAFKIAGYSCECLPTLCFEFVNTSQMRTCLLTPSSYHGLILTSRRAAEAIELASKEDDSILRPWKTLPVYCVGPATESFVKTQLGLENCLGKETGNAKELAELLVASVAKDTAPLLYPCSEIGRETIEKALSDNDIGVHRIVVYKTLPNECLEHELLKFMDDVPKIFVFFSPSTVEHVVNLLRKKCYDLNKVKAVAIGPVTSQALRDAGLKIFATAGKPEPTSLIKAISDSERCE